MTHPPEATGATVLVADGSAFEADYVASVLAARGLQVAGPVAEPVEALDMLRAGPVHAAVIGDGGGNAMAALIAELERSGIPYLTLLHRAPPSEPPDKAVLAAPFAGYQVADWVTGAVGERAAPAGVYVMCERALIEA